MIDLSHSMWISFTIWDFPSCKKLADVDLNETAETDSKITSCCFSKNNLIGVGSFYKKNNFSLIEWKNKKDFNTLTTVTDLPAACQSVNISKDEKFTGWCCSDGSVSCIKIKKD
eukprot:GHVL01006807.1.p1 GENE.GHVL01006807.1~~GHVL01006807.1.p1  ORF type:complete len:114 (+),score=24.42 GHVL01006807.1:109-450(+)